MSRQNQCLCCFFILSLVTFFLSPSMERLWTSETYQGTRIGIMYLTGVIAIKFMSLAVIISARYSFINNFFGGLDKVYRLHRLSAEIGFTFGLIHYLIYLFNKVMVNIGMIQSGRSSNNLQGIILQLYDASHIFLEPAFILIIVLVAISLLKKIPYHIFQYTHKFIPVLYLVIAFHAIVTPIRGAWLGTVGGAILYIVLFFGIVSALISIFQQIGFKHKNKGKIKYINNIGADILTLNIELDKTFKYQAGQFVFIKFKHSMEPHPFSIASYTADNVIKFYIKESGDWTKQLHSNIKNGDEVTIEGPYGDFIFNDNSNQIWIAGGIGITPFIARLEYLANNKTNQEICLLYSNQAKSEIDDMLVSLCEKAGVKLTIVDTTKSGMLTFDKIKEMLPNISTSSVWFCGPTGFRKVIQKGFKENNFNLSNIHYDIFMFR